MDCESFPFAYRTAWNLVRKAIEAKQNPSMLIKQILILGPVNTRGERMKYNYAEAAQLATDQGLLTAGGDINSKEFKRR